MQEPSLLFTIAILIISVIIHEVSHGYMAYYLGDPTAKLAGRLTLNPLSHLDPFGSVILPLLLIISRAGLVIGWAKPVPYNPYNLRGGRLGPAYVAAAGPLANLIIVGLFALLIRSGIGLALGGEIFVVLAAEIVLINLLLAFFNLIPVPPLDGSKILFGLLPYRFHALENWINRYQLILLLIVIFVLWDFLAGLIFYLFHLLVGLS